MKIAMLGDFPPRVGGVSSHIYSLSKKLVSLGHEVFVITYSHENLENLDGIKVISAKIIDKPIIRPFLFKINAKRKLDELVKKEHIDIIHGHLIYPVGAVATEIGEKYNIPTYVTVHGGDIYELYKKHPLLRKPIENVLIKADKILAVSNKIKNEIINTNIVDINKKTSIHWNAVNIDKFKEISSKRRKDKPTMICVTRLVKSKNVNLLLDAKKQTKMDFNLIIVGDGPEKHHLENKVKKEKINNVTFTGFRSDVEKILPHADLFVLPSIDEAFGIAYIEALACGLPIIGCNNTGAKEIITSDVGLLIKPNSVSSLTDAIDKILNNEKLYNKFKSNVRKKAIEFSEMKIPYSEIK